jgi:cyanophycin synthetase
MGIPATIAPGGIILCGWGKNSRFLNSSGTEHTAALSAEVVRDKLAAQVMMMRFGLPVAEARLANDSESARIAANEIGYPVVVKPRAEDGGEGVTRAVKNDASLFEAFKLARISKSGVLVQRHIEGREYRLTVVNQKIICAYERMPAMVEGDGKSTVVELVACENARRESATDQAVRDFPIILGEDADRNLADQHLDTSKNRLILA